MAEQATDRRQRHTLPHGYRSEAVPQIMRANIWQRACSTKPPPECFERHVPPAPLFREHQRYTFATWQTLENSQCLPVEHDDLCPGLAVGQHKARRLDPIPVKPANLVQARAGEDQQPDRRDLIGINVLYFGKLTPEPGILAGA